MPGTIEQLRTWETYLGTNLKSVESLRANDVRTVAAGAHREMRKLFSGVGSDNVALAIRGAHQGNIARFPSELSDDGKVIDFWRQRYPHLSDSNDREAFCTWYTQLIALGTQAAAFRLLLTGCGNGAADTLSTTTPLPFRPRPATTVHLKQRKEEMTGAVDIVAESMPWFRKNLGLASKDADKAAIEKELRKLGDGLLVGMHDEKTMKAALGTQLIPMTEKHPAWPDSVTVGGNALNLPSRMFAKVASLDITHFGCNQGLRTTSPTRAIETLLKQHPDTMVEWKIS